MTTRHSPTNRTFAVENLGAVAAPKPKVRGPGNGTKEREIGLGAVYHTVDVAWMPNDDYDSQEVIFFADPSPIEKQIYKLTVAGTSSRRGNFKVDRFELPDNFRPLRPKEASRFCKSVYELLVAQLTEGKVLPFTASVIDPVFLLKGAR
ncbi:MAG: hypothetical protein O2821_12705 [Chloroflexi bacterium]|nr:hypothetical protein [Chloroflexota bacterium]